MRRRLMIIICILILISGITVICISNKTKIPDDIVVELCDIDRQKTLDIFDNVTVACERYLAKQITDEELKTRLLVEKQILEEQISYIKKLLADYKIDTNELIEQSISDMRLAQEELLNLINEGLKDNIEDRQFIETLSLSTQKIKEHFADHYDNLAKYRFFAE